MHALTKLSVCNGPEKCVFVRVVDSCQGCEPGSRHVDLTVAAFEALGDLDTGVMQVNMRLASHPTQWYVSGVLICDSGGSSSRFRFERLWGPEL